MTSPHSPPTSQWTRTAPPPPDTAPAQGEGSADLVVIGAGITGLSTALHALEEGLSVTVLEAEGPGFGGSGRNNGQIIPTLSKPDPSDLTARWGEAGERFARLVGGSAAMTFALIERHGIACEASATGWLQPAHRPSRLRVSEKRQREWSALGLECRLVDARECATMTGSAFWHGGLFCPTGGHVNPLALARGLARVVMERGGQLFTNSAVTGIVRDGAQWRVDTARSRTKAARVVIASNAYTGRIAGGPWTALSRTIVPVTNFQMATEVLPSDPLARILPRNPALSDTQGDLYFFRRTKDGRLVAGCTLPSRGATEDQAAALVAGRIARVFPHLGKPRIETCWSGQLGFTPDFHPRFHELAPGVLAAIGYNGRGMALGMAVGRELARASAGTPFAQVDLPNGGMPRTLPLHGLITQGAPLMMYWWRRKDRRD